MARRPRPSEAPRSGGVRCAIYTRKSTEEGLEQAFNSLHAQREACAAYIASQKHEGWSLVRDSYDDGGFSGGTMERPGLKRLLAEVALGKVDVIVVYKVDRLTRALSDFAKIVEVLDARGASFVSITQAFNTTTSMGRLTLNVLLSFAQFEREVTGERIRDKIAASKKKGLWMGGPVPLGYDVRDRQLVVNEADAATVRHIFERYVALGAGRALIEELRIGGYRTKRRLLANGARGGVPFARGALFHLLGNRIYIGAIVHKGEAHAGAHPAIIDRALWDAAQDTIARNAVERRSGGNIAHASLLAGILHDAEDRRMTPSHAKKAGKRYRYYVTSASEMRDGEPARRVPAHDVEAIVVSRIRKLLETPSDIRRLVQPVDRNASALQVALAQATRLSDRLLAGEQRRTIVATIIARVRLLDDRVEVELHRAALLKLLCIDQPDNGATLHLAAAACRVRHGKDIRLVMRGDDGHAERNQPLAALIAEAHAFRELMLSSPGETVDQVASRLGRCRSRSAKLLRLSFLAPDITTAIVEGRPTKFGVRDLLHRALPSEWNDQRGMLRLD